MSDSFEYDAVGRHATPSLNVGKITAMGTALVALNILLMLALSYTPVAAVGALLFSNFFVGIVFFVVTVGGGFWLSSRGVERGNYPLTGVGVTLTQVGYGVLGAAILLGAATSLRLQAIGIATVVTGVITAGVALYVFNTDRSFEGWQRYAFFLFVGGFAVGAVGYFTSRWLLLGATVFFFLGFLVDLVYEIWAVRENRYASDLRNAIGIYVAVMGVFVHVLMWALELLSIADS